MPASVRPHPLSIAGALGLLLLPTGWVAFTGALAPALTWILLAFGTLLAGASGGGFGRSAVRGLAILLTLLLLLAWTGLGLQVGSWLLCIVLALFCLRGRAQWGADLPGPLLLGVLGIGFALAMLMAFDPAPLQLGTDAPAHVGAIHDALRGDDWIPEDHSLDPDGHGVDPRFGVVHGLYAAMSQWSGQTPGEVLAASPILLAPLWFAAHAWLFTALGLPSIAAIVTALIFTLHVGAGRGFALWSSGFPGSVALMITALCLAALVGELRRRELRLGHWNALVVALGLSTIVHPFAWWITLFTLAQATLVMFLVGRLRSQARTLLLTVLGAGLIGIVALLPRLLDRSGGGLHTELNEVLLLGGGWFVADPQWIVAWGGLGAVLALPALVLAGRRWWSDPGHLIAGTTALSVWTISLNPLAMKLLWPLVSYLTIRVSRTVLTTWVWGALLIEGVHALQNAARPKALVRAILLGLLALSALFFEVRTTFKMFGHGVSTDANGTWERLEAMRAACREGNVDVLLAEPRIAYGIRAIGGPSQVLLPVAHASPRDHTLLERMETYRSLFAAGQNAATFLERLDSLGAHALLLDLNTETTHTNAPAYGYVPDDERNRTLDRWLVNAAWPEIRRTDDWVLFDLRTPPRLAGDFGEREAPSLAPSSPWDEPLRASTFGVVAVEVPGDEVRAGDTFELLLHYAEAEKEPYGRGSAHPELERLHLRVQGTMPAVPAWARSFDKLYRKAWIERSGRSRNRFGRSWLPGDGIGAPSDWPQGRRSETVQIRIPDHLPPGRYELQLSVQEWRWHERHDLRDYLRDEDRYRGDVVGTITVIP